MGGIEELDAIYMRLAAADQWQSVEMDALVAAMDISDAKLEEKHRTAAARVSAALWYAEAGLAVFPVQYSKKSPQYLEGSFEHGVLDASRDPATIRAWWERWPTSNIGIATGQIIDVVDVDGYNGHLSMAKRESWASLKVLATVATPRAGGMHLWIGSNGMGNAARLEPGIDYRGIGGYVLAPPSFVIEDSYEGFYRFAEPPAKESLRQPLGAPNPALMGRAFGEAKE